jgi:glutaredoxin-related protein
MTSTPTYPFPAHDTVVAARSRFHADVVAEVAAAVAAERVLVVGMAWNPFVGRARRALTARGVAFRYLEYGNYLSSWKPRLALKMWAGWPTFPMVFVRGRLVGGCTDLEKLLGSGEFDRLLSEP